MKVARLDHLVLTVNNIEVTSQFYSNVLGMDIVTFGEGRVALTFGEQKINLHQLGNEFEPKAAQIQSGSADLCFITPTPIDEVQSHIESQGVTIIDGPIQRTGAMGKIISVYLRDPDGNLIELSNYL
ncbi:VOC family protein [Aliivibrio fischeri]|uniref:VOC family protein n=1 Tax=Aliivibrio fischeri TaxID=668 RepID=UPI0012DA26B9|nr:VOC family protein [Aliivibrio fischeri]MUK69824.1 VOC family protein [Aliivibrio fischeri]MUK72358.1 VOC family protein [Aliivibrio fischeri]